MAEDGQRHAAVRDRTYADFPVAAPLRLRMGFATADSSPPATLAAARECTGAQARPCGPDVEARPPAPRKTVT